MRKNQQKINIDDTNSIMFISKENEDFHVTLRVIKKQDNSICFQINDYSDEDTTLLVKPSVSNEIEVIFQRSQEN